MAINPDEITTIRVDQLAPDTLNLTDKFPHTVGTDLKSSSIQDLVDLVATAIGVTGGVGYLPLSVTDGQQLPDVPENPSFFLCGAGTFLNINGYPDIICTAELNAIMSLTDHWALAVEIPIDAPIGVNSVTGSAVDNTDPQNPVINLQTVPNLTQVLQQGDREVFSVESSGFTFDLSSPTKLIIDNFGGTAFNLDDVDFPVGSVIKIVGQDSTVTSSTKGINGVIGQTYSIPTYYGVEIIKYAPTDWVLYYKEITIKSETPQIEGILSQAGGNDGYNIGSGDLVTGVSYQILDNSGGADFTANGAPDNNVGTWFICNNVTTVANWGTATLSYNNGAPTINILKNTLGNTWFEFVIDGTYYWKSNGLFRNNKTILPTPYHSQLDGYDVVFQYMNASTIQITTYDAGILRNDVLYNLTTLYSILLKSYL